MSQGKKFGTSILGFKKKDVNEYLEKILSEFDDRIKEKDNEISILKNKYKEAMAQYQEALKKSDELIKERGKIADALIKAQEKADLILREVKISAQEEEKKYQDLIQKEKAKLEQIKNDIIFFKNEALSTLNKYAKEFEDLENIVPS